MKQATRARYAFGVVDGCFDSLEHYDPSSKEQVRIRRAINDALNMREYRVEGDTDNRTIMLRLSTLVHGILYRLGYKFPDNADFCAWMQKYVDPCYQIDVMKLMEAAPGTL